MNLRTAILWSAAWFPTVAISALVANSAGLFRPKGFVDQFQTLIGAGVALAAALIAVVPVWRQLDRLGTQTNISLRETLGERLRALRARQASVTQPLEKVQGGIATQIYVMIEEEMDRVDPEWAFAHQQAAELAQGRLAEIRREWHDPADIPAAMDAADKALDQLRDTLDAISLPERVDRFDEELEISDADWEEMLREAVEARQVLPRVSNDFDRAVDAVNVAFETEVQSLLRRLHNLDKILMNART